MQLLYENCKIDSRNLKWYAAFHNESHHPHVHLVVYSSCLLYTSPERIWRTDADFYVLTNNMDHGAVYMMDEATLQKSAEKLDGNLIVLPASIHDVYLMVEREGLDMERLRNGVYGANRAFPEADYLSDEIYR